MEARLTRASIAFLSATLALGCQEQGSGPLDPDAAVIQAASPSAGIVADMSDQEIDDITAFLEAISKE